MINRLLILLLLTALAFSSCQKEVSEDIGPLQGDTGIWFLVSKQVNGYENMFGGQEFLTKASYTFDSIARQVLYSDTTTFKGQSPIIRKDRMTYDTEGRLIQVYSDYGSQGTYERNLFYGQDGHLEKIVLPDRQVTMAWSTQGANKVVQSADPMDNTGPYTFYNHTFTLDPNDRLLKKVTHSIDATRGDAYEEITRGSAGGAIIRVRYELINGTREALDSTVYIREMNRPARLSRFYELLGNGIQWYSDSYGILYIEPPSLYSEYYEYEANLCNKSTHYETYIENGQPDIFVYEIQIDTQYDTDDNPVKQSVYFLGEKIADIEFTWQKINWLID